MRRGARPPPPVKPLRRWIINDRAASGRSDDSVRDNRSASDRSHDSLTTARPLAISIMRGRPHAGALAACASATPSRATGEPTPPRMHSIRCGAAVCYCAFEGGLLSGGSCFGRDALNPGGGPSPGRYCRSTLPFHTAIPHCHWRPFLRDVHSNLAGIVCIDSHPLGMYTVALLPVLPRSARDDSGAPRAAQAGPCCPAGTSRAAGRCETSTRTFSASLIQYRVLDVLKTTEHRSRSGAREGSSFPAEGAWARVTIDHCRHSALQTLYRHRLFTTILAAQF